MKTKIYCDIADINQIKTFNKKNIVKGFTTNPSLMRKAGAKNYENYSKKILKICKKPISLEVFGDDYKSMKRQAFIINSWGKNIYVKIPVINSKGNFMGKLIKELSLKNIKLNITAVYNSSQTKKILKCLNKNSKTIIPILIEHPSFTKNLGEKARERVLERYTITKNINSLEKVYMKLKDNSEN